jgi:hypothetical protein
MSVRQMRLIAAAERAAGLEQGSVRLLIRFETAAALSGCAQTLRAAPPRVLTGGVGLGDLAKDLGVDFDPVVAARAPRARHVRDRSARAAGLRATHRRRVSATGRSRGARSGLPTVEVARVPGAARGPSASGRHDQRGVRLAERHRATNGAADRRGVRAGGGRGACVHRRRRASSSTTPSMTVRRRSSPRSADANAPAQSRVLRFADGDDAAQ